MRALPLAALSFCCGCLPSLDDPSNAHDLRILGMRAEPPEIIVAGGLPASLQPIRFEALVVDPAGGGRPLEYEYFVCPDASQLDCTEDSRAVRLGPFSLRGEVACAQYLPTESWLLAAVEADPFHGATDVRTMVTLRVRAPTGEAIGGKRLVLILNPLPGQSANQNPPEPELLLGGAPWPAGESRALAPEAALDASPVEPQQEYLLRTLDGGVLQVRERWKYRWFTTRGAFSPEETGGADPITGLQEPTATHWQLGEGEGAGPLRVWAVVRDGRGGESWTWRDAALGP